MRIIRQGVNNRRGRSTVTHSFRMASKKGNRHAEGQPENTMIRTQVGFNKKASQDVKLDLTFGQKDNLSKTL